MSERSERHGRKELAPLTRRSRRPSARATDWHPSVGPAAHRGPAAEDRPIRPRQGRIDAARLSRPRRRRSEVAGRRTRSSPSPVAGGSAAGELAVGGSAVLRCWVGRGRRVLRRDGCGSLRGDDRRQAAGLRRVARSANALTALAQPRSLLRTRKPPPTARYCCAAPALARRQQSLRSIDKPLRSFVAAGQGSLTIFITGPRILKHGRRRTGRPAGHSSRASDMYPEHPPARRWARGHATPVAATVVPAPTGGERLRHPSRQCPAPSPRPRSTTTGSTAGCASSGCSRARSSTRSTATSTG